MCSRQRLFWLVLEQTHSCRRQMGRTIRHPEWLRRAAPSRHRRGPCLVHHSGPSPEAAILCRPAGKRLVPPRDGLLCPASVWAKIPTTWAENTNLPGLASSSHPGLRSPGSALGVVGVGGAAGMARLRDIGGEAATHQQGARDGRLRHDRPRGFSPARRGGDPG